MITRPLRLASERKSLRLTDILGMAAGVALLVAILSAVVIVAPRQPKVEISQEEIIENARKLAVKAALAHREGTILFVDPDRCQEHSFDNWTGNQAYREQVDCDARLALLRKNDVERAAERMRSVSEAFRR